MAKQEQVLIIEPQQELKFIGPYTSPVTSYIKLTNPSERRVCFKIKTTAPKQYCVRPNSGFLERNSLVEIAVSLQPQPQDFPVHENYKHKFMVQTMFAPDEEVDVDKMWKEIVPENLMDSKLKCVFESGPEQTPTPAPESGGEAAAGVEKKVKATKVSSVKASPKAGPQVEGELARAAVEVKMLREEESSLRQQNLMLKEEVLRLRRVATSADSNPDSRERIDSMGNSSDSLGQQQVAGSLPIYVVFAVVAVLLGILLGKFIL